LRDGQRPDRKQSFPCYKLNSQVVQHHLFPKYGALVVLPLKKLTSPQTLDTGNLKNRHVLCGQLIHLSACEFSRRQVSDRRVRTPIIVVDSPALNDSSRVINRVQDVRV